MGIIFAAKNLKPQLINYYICAMIATSIEQNILDCMPYQAPFRFIEEILEISDEHIIGSYTFKENEFFYRGHFPGNPVTPGVILTECMAQIGLVALGIHIYQATPELMKNLKVFFTNNQISYYRTVLPNEKVIVKSNKIYFRLKSLKCEVTMENESGELIAKGVMAGMFATT
jgi:3-hydroxyacyl-[acyl-carrier-protein] dehydratase